MLIYSNQVDADELLMSDAQLTQLRSHLETIHDSFKLLYDPDEDERFAMEIEFKITSDDILAIKQARPWVFRPTNKPPKFLETETGIRTVTENAPVGRLLGAPVEATDEEGDELTYSMSGDDADWFRTGQRDRPVAAPAKPGLRDRESTSRCHQGGRSVQPVRRQDRVDGQRSQRGRMGNELELSSLQGRVGTALTATLSDPDGGISVTSWEWQRSRNRNTWSTIYGATGNRYTPTTADIDHYLRVSVTYYDNAPGHHGIGTATRHPTKDRPSNNQAPTFDHPTYERSVAENASAGTFVGAALIARDADNDILEL